MFKRAIATLTVAAMIVTLGLACGVILAIILTGPGKSQPRANPQEQALGAKLLAEIQAGLTCSAEKITAERRVEELERRLKELEPKPAPEKK